MRRAIVISTVLLLAVASAPAAAKITETEIYPAMYDLKGVDVATSGPGAPVLFTSWYRSGDLGATWTDSHVAGESIQALSTSTQIAAAGCAVTIHAEQPRRFETESGGTCRHPLVGVRFLDPARGLLLKDDGSVVVTSDGGATLAEGTSVPGKATALRETPSGAFLAAIDDGRVFRSTDFGSSWAQVVGPGAVTRGFTAIGSQVVSVGASATVRLSDDDGQTWKTLALGIPAQTDLARVACNAPDRCAALTPDGRTVVRFAAADGPAAQFGVGNRPLRGLVWVDHEHLVLVGDRGQIARSADGGATFKVEARPVEGLHDLAIGPDDSAIAVGTGGLVLHTTDGGRTVIPEHVPGATFLSNAALSASGRAAVSDGDSVFLADPGQPWRTGPTDKYVAEMWGLGGSTFLINTGHGFHRVRADGTLGPAIHATKASHFWEAASAGRQLAGDDYGELMYSGDAGATLHFHRVVVRTGTGKRRHRVPSKDILLIRIVLRPGRGMVACGFYGVGKKNRQYHDITVSTRDGRRWRLKHTDECPSAPMASVGRGPAAYADGLITPAGSRLALDYLGPSGDTVLGLKAVRPG